MNYQTIIAQVNPVAAAVTTLYNAATTHQIFADSIVICNGGADGTFDISMSLNNDALDPKQYIFKDQILGAGKTTIITLELFLLKDTTIEVLASNNDFAFQLKGLL